MPAVRSAMYRLADGIVEEIRTENPVYADVLEGPEGVGIRLGIEQAIGAFLDAIERGENPGGETAEVWRRLGEAEFQAGRNLDALRAAWCTGTRAAWRGAADLAAEAGMPTRDGDRARGGDLRVHRRARQRRRRGLLRRCSPMRRVTECAAAAG